MKKEVKLGIFFIFTAVVFVVGILFFGKIKLSQAAYSFYIDYNFSGDLKKNGKVRYRGGTIDIGYIEDFFINEFGTITIKVMMTDKNLKLPLDTLFTIQTVGFGIGEKYILANPPLDPTPNMDYIREGDIIRGVDPTSMEETLGSFGDIGKDFDITVLNEIFEDVQNTVALLNQILEANEMYVNGTLSNVDGISADLKRLSANLPRYERKIESVLNNADATLLHARNILEVVDKEKHRIPVIIRNMEVFSDRVRRDPSNLLFSRPEQTNK